MASSSYFTPELFVFLRQLKRNNRRDWFQRNKPRYEAVVRDPCLRFIADLAEPLAQISTWLNVDPRPMGGSLFRIYRDIRFSDDKRPYKTHIGMHFSVRAPNQDIHSPGYYLHLEPEGCFVAAGIWRPETRTLLKIRDAIVRQPDAWAKAKRGLELEGDTLSRPPRGYDPKHRFIEDLKFKDFLASESFSDAAICRGKFLAEVTAACRRLSPLMQFLAQALGLKY